MYLIITLIIVSPSIELFPPFVIVNKIQNLPRWPWINEHIFFLKKCATFTVMFKLDPLMQMIHSSHENNLSLISARTAINNTNWGEGSLPLQKRHSGVKRILIDLNIGSLPTKCSLMVRTVRFYT